MSIYGNMQPQVLTENFGKLAQDGLLQRFLPAVLRHDQTRMGNPTPEYLTRLQTERSDSAKATRRDAERASLKVISKG